MRTLIDIQDDLMNELLKEANTTVKKEAIILAIKTFLDAGLIHEIVMPGDVKKLALCNDCEHGPNEHASHHQHNHGHLQVARRAVVLGS